MYKPYNFVQKSEYFNESMIYFIEGETNFEIQYIEYKDNINWCEYTNLSKILVIYDKDIKLIDKIKFPKYPIIDFTNSRIIITSIILLQLKGLPKFSNFGDCIKKMLINIKEYLGCVLTDNLDLLTKSITLGDIYNNLYYENDFLRNNNVIKLNFESSKMFSTNEHGWLSKDTKLNLEYGITKYKPTNILELGSWMGKSTCYMRKLIDANFYCFDKFQNVCLSPYLIKSYNPINKFYFTCQRLETFSKNIMNIKNRDNNVYAIRKDAYKSLEFMHKYGINVDMIFIDFIKSQYKLYTFLCDCIRYFPNTIIVGDDYVFDTVKQGVAKFIMRNQKIKIGLLDESYIVSKNLRDYHLVKNEFLKYKNIKKDINQGIIKNTNDKYKYVYNLLKENKFFESLNYIKENKIDLNKIIGNKTLYHDIAKISKYDKEIFTLFENYQKPEKINDELLLTYEDYLNYEVRL